MKAGSLFMGWIMLSASKSSKNLLTIWIVKKIGGEKYRLCLPKLHHKTIVDMSGSCSMRSVYHKKTVSKLSDYRQAKTIKSATTDQTKSPGKRPQESKIGYVHNDVDSSKNWMSNSNKGGNRGKIETTQNNKDGQ